MRLRARRAFTLTELGVVMAVVAVLVAFLLVAIVRAQEAGARLQSRNNLKQINLALHNFASVNKGEMPTVGSIVPVQPNPGNPTIPNINRPSLFVRLLPYIDQSNVPARGSGLPVPLYISPADPTAVALVAKGQGACSYACNAQVFNFDNDPRMPGTFRDGTSCTITFAEHYAECGGRTILYWNHWVARNRPSFADYGDYVPTTSGDPPTSFIAESPLLTYQTAPPVNKCDGGLPQTPHPSGMLVALGDGSVRQISPNISPTTFWAAVTPAAGDNLGPDW